MSLKLHAGLALRCLVTAGMAGGGLDDISHTSTFYKVQLSQGLSLLVLTLYEPAALIKMVIRGTWTQIVPITRHSVFL